MSCKSNIYDVRLHLYERGFMQNYYIWTSHGENIRDDDSIVFEIPVTNQRSLYETVVMDSIIPKTGSYNQKLGHFIISFWDNDNEMRIEEEPNAEVRAFCDILNATRKPLWEGCEEESLLLAISIKTNTNMSE